MFAEGVISSDKNPYIVEKLRGWNELQLNL